MNDKNAIPARECVFVAQVDIKDRGDGDHRSTPFTAVARTGDALNHSYWGRVVHDLEGMRVKSRIPIDFNHQPDDIVGYANRFNTDTGDLEIKGALTPSKHDSKHTAEMIIDKAEMGVPWEMSITFPGDLEIETIPEGEQVTVNNRQFTGPLTVIRSWPLRGVAITPYGHDAQTSLQFANDAVVHYTEINRETVQMSKDELTVAEAEVVSDEAVDAAVTKDAEAQDETPDAVDATDDSAEGTDASLETDEATPADVTPESKPVLSTGAEYMTKFGRVQGALYFADGLSLDEATAKELERLQVENAELKCKAKTSGDDLDEPLSFSAETGEESNVWNSVPGMADLKDKTPARGHV